VGRTRTYAPDAQAPPVAVGRYPGIDIDYHERPKRKYTLNGEQVPSVTTAIGIVDKPGLKYYAETETAEGARRLARMRGYRFPGDITVPEGARALLLPKRATDPADRGRWLYERKDVQNARERFRSAQLIQLKAEWGSTLPAARLVVAHLRIMRWDHQSATNNAADRGLDVHAVWEAWNERQEIPNAQAYPEDRRGYIRAMSKFIVEHQPECFESEQVVGSAVYGFAGRLDTVVVIRASGVPLSMLDVKTAKQVHSNSHFPQLQGYEIARRECGLEPTERQGILRLGKGGDYELAWSDDPRFGGPTTDEDFLSLLAAWRSQHKWRSGGGKGRR
jgi:hypothetical protein